MITGIGSFPFTDVDEAIDVIFASCGEIPFWPQLPQRSPVENMYITFLESVPSVVIDEEKGSAFVDTTKTEGIEEFYENCSSNALDTFAVSEKVAPGFYRFLERLQEIRPQVKFIKCQITGPFSMGLGLKDEQDKPIIYNPGFFDIILKALHMKAQWMIRTIKASYPEKDIIIFFDEPYMVSFGSAYVSIPKEDAVAMFNEVGAGLDAKRGIHCCGNTDWSVLLNADIDIINFDAYNYLDTIFYYGDDLARFIAKGGRIAPGLVPSSEDVLKVSVKEIEALKTKFIDSITGIDARVKDQDILITPSCGLGSLTEQEARRAMELLKELQ
ncbi:MAG: methionine synthase [Syntrophorhabdus sp. PtaU1.Bin058]|nr:MAG: methionine synthase [Syntrophorhabdus sp. PtaU1.Bin058]